jgi:hypothetical protein
MKKILSALLVLLALASCSNDAADQKAGAIKKTGTKNEQDKKSNVKLDLFSMPSFIDGCAELLTYDTCKAEDKYVFASDYGDNVIIKIKGKEIKLKRDTAESKRPNEKNYIDVYRGNGYKVVMHLKIIKQYEEAAELKGTLQITGNKTEATFKIRGTSGC